MKVIVYETDVGGTAPTLSSTQIRLAKVITDASNAISIIVDSNVPTRAVNGGKLVAASVDSAQLANSAVGTAQLASDAVTAPKIAAAAITTPKIANFAIGPVHQTMNAPKKGMFANSQFNIASKK